MSVCSGRGDPDPRVALLVGTMGCHRLRHVVTCQKSGRLDHVVPRTSMWCKGNNQTICWTLCEPEPGKGGSFPQPSFLPRPQGVVF